LGVFTVFQVTIPVYLSLRHSNKIMKGYFYIFLLGCISCQPKVVAFTALPPSISSGDSVHLAWRTRGVATMSFHQKRIYVPPDSVQALEFILTATRGGKVSAPEIRQVVLDQRRDEVALNLTGQTGDSVIYSASKDVAYQSFNVVSLSILDGIPVTVLHMGQTCVLTTPGVAVTCMQGIPYSGYWEVRIKMTAAEIADHHQIPPSYSLVATITPK
jgi:hypothetical protein